MTDHHNMMTTALQRRQQQRQHLLQLHPADDDVVETGDPYDFSPIAPPTISTTKEAADHSHAAAAAAVDDDVTSSPFPSTSTVTTTMMGGGTSTSSTSTGSHSTTLSPRSKQQQQHRRPPPPPPSFEPEQHDNHQSPPTVSSSTSPAAASFLSASLLRRQKRRHLNQQQQQQLVASHYTTTDVTSSSFIGRIPTIPIECGAAETDTNHHHHHHLPSSSSPLHVTASPGSVHDPLPSDDDVVIREIRNATQYRQRHEYHEAWSAYERATSYCATRLQPFLSSSSSSSHGTDLPILLQPWLALAGITTTNGTSRPSHNSTSSSSCSDIVPPPPPPTNRNLAMMWNAADCFWNMGTIAHLIPDATFEPLFYYHAAQYWYQRVQEFWIEQQQQQPNDEPLQNDPDDSMTTTTTTKPHHDQTNNQVICLPLRIVEVMQRRARHSVTNVDVSQAIACYEECVRHLVGLSWQNPRAATIMTLAVDAATVTTVTLTTFMTQMQWMECMTDSLKHLGHLYRSKIPESIIALQTFQESIHLVKESIPWDDVETNDSEATQTSYCYVIKTTIEVLRLLSELYTEYCSRQNADDENHNRAMDCAIDALHDAMDVELRYNYVCHVEPNAEALQAIDQMGLANEQLQQYEKALTCYEKALLARSQYYGEHHIDVAKSLINVARIMEIQGNVEGSLDLYRAAHAIYTYQITSTQPTIFASGEDASAILQLIPNLLEKERYEEARAYLMKCLTIVEREEQAKSDNSDKTTTTKKSTLVDKSQIYYDLGRACIGLKDNVSATIYLVESAKVENGKVTEEQVLSLLQHIDSMQRRDERNGITKHTAPPTDDIPHQLLQKIYSLDESIRLSTRSSDEQLNLTSSNLVSVPSRGTSKNSIPTTTSFRTASPATSYKKRISHETTGKLNPRSATFSTASSRDLDFEQDYPIERPESVLSGFTSLLQSEGSQYSSNNKNNHPINGENFPESDVSGVTSLFNDDSRSRNFNSRPTLSTNTVPTMDLISNTEPNFRSELFDPCHTNNNNIGNIIHSENRRRPLASDLRGLTDEEMTIQLIEHTHISTMSGSFTSPKRPQESKDGSKRSPSQNATSRSFMSSDGIELQIPISFETNEDRSKESSRSKMSTGHRGLLPRSAPTTPRKMKDEKSTSSSQQRHKPMLTKVFGEKLRRRPRREGFVTLSDSPPTQRKVLHGNESELPTEEEITEEGSAVTGTVPVFLVGGIMDADDLSEITMRHFNDLNSSPRDTSQEWWWGVTAEGFGRWFPTTYVTQAVQAADAFLSAKAIHAQSPRCLHQKSLPMNGASIGNQVQIPVSATKVDNNVDEEKSVSDSSSQDQQDIASNVGITSTKASRVNFLDYTSDKGYLTHEGAQNSLRTQSFPLNLFTSPAPSQRRDYDNGKDIVSEILACRELLLAQQKQFGASDATVANTLFKLAILYSRDRDIEAAIECANEALRIQVKMENIEDSAQSLHFLADLYLHQKEYKHALTHYNRALSYETNFFGYISDSVAKTLNCIGMVKLLQNDFRLSMESHQQALCILQECYDGDSNDGTSNCSSHPFVMDVLCHIGNVYYRERHQDSNSVAGSTATLSVSSRCSEKYTTHLDSTMFERLARAYEDRGLCNMAIYFLKEKSHYLESANVEQTMDVLDESAGIYNRLGLLSCYMGSYDIAIQYFERALSLRLQLGCTAVQVAISRAHIAYVHYHLGQYNSALLSYHDALECYHTADEIEDSDKDTLQEHIALTLYYMGIVQAALCDYNTAMVTLSEAHTIQQESLGMDHTSTLRTRREIGNLNALYIGDVPIGLKYFQSIVATQKRIHNIDRHPSIAETLHSIGLAYIRQKDYSKALRTLEDCYYMRLEFFASDHPVLATTLFDIAKVYLLLQRHSYHKVLQIFDYVLHIRLVKLNAMHIDIARVNMMKGVCHVGIGNVDDAYTCFKDAYDMATQCLKHDSDGINENHVVFGEIYTEWSTLYLMKCQFDVARSYAEKALTIYQANLQMDDDYDGIIAAQEILRRIEQDEMLCV